MSAQSEFIHDIEAFRAVDGGVVNGKAEIDYVLAKIPEIDRQRLYSVGYGSAATVSLLLAEKDHRIAACISYSPVFNVFEQTNMNSPLMSYYGKKIPDFQQDLTSISPSTYLNQLTCPVFISEGQDVHGRTSASEPYLEQLKRSNPQFQYAVAPVVVDHATMLQDGIPNAIAWLQQLAK